jgi:hypothetical protein
LYWHGISMMTKYFVMEYLYWLNILYWNIHTE